jgi:ribonucleotide reductase beta subunit family protein with ferritin-like domain
VSAPKYVEYLMDWIETQLDEETIFPQKLGEWFVWSQSIRTLKNCILIIWDFVV